MKHWKLALACVIAAIAVVLAVAWMSQMLSYGHTRSEWTGTFLTRMAQEIMLEGTSHYRPTDPPLSLPTGDVRALYRWCEKRGRLYGGISHWLPFADEKEGTFRDYWGHELVYRFPSARPEAVFDLYSVGPNGIDESGKGDDITCGRAADYAMYSDRISGNSIPNGL